jgi:hypothetical protein
VHRSRESWRSRQYGVLHLTTDNLVTASFAAACLFELRALQTELVRLGQLLFRDRLPRDRDDAIDFEIGNLGRIRLRNRVVRMRLLPAIAAAAREQKLAAA